MKLKAKTSMSYEDLMIEFFRKVQPDLQDWISGYNDLRNNDYFERTSQEFQRVWTKLESLRLYGYFQKRNYYNRIKQSNIAYMNNIEVKEKNSVFFNSTYALNMKDKIKLSDLLGIMRQNELKLEEHTGPEAPILWFKNIMRYDESYAYFKENIEYVMNREAGGFQNALKTVETEDFFLKIISVETNYDNAGRSKQAYLEHLIENDKIGSLKDDLTELKVPVEFKKGVHRVSEREQLIKVYKTENNRGVLIITNRLGIEEIALGYFYLQLMSQNKLYNEEEMDLLKALLTRDVDKINAVMSNIDYFQSVKDNDISPFAFLVTDDKVLDLKSLPKFEKTDEDLLKEIEENTAKLNALKTQRQRDHLQREIQRQNEFLKNYYMYVENVNKAKTQLRIAEEIGVGDVTEFVQFLMNTPSVVDFEFGDNMQNLALGIRTYLNNYDEEDAVLQKTNLKFISSSLANTVFEELYINKTTNYELVVIQSIVLNLENGRMSRIASATNEFYEYAKENQYLAIRNPHIHEYDCFGSYAIQTQNAIENGDLVAAVQLAITSVANLNTIDSAPMSEWERYIRNHANHKILEIPGTAERITPNELVQLLNEEKQNDSQES